MKFELLTLVLTLLFTLTLSLPTAVPTTEDTSVSPATDINSEAQTTLVCHSGLPASVCASVYGASCSDNGGFYSHPAPDGKSCTSRQCFCRR
ncbi:hypothetical protein ONS95_001112 [Cadophora gregata]|uniref:uncharacterized protein n=1 Tax=Cadophora gregata TaxID=51156 RepID=UPI0026DBAF48|nr:uncharacterized protein ONS95_001112 [Cadophora gregata]KAK0102089.1 hypothetical protein ONS96_006052 [Cadophora gregata f. sp. sojae]KAK0129178.1 hypothetical protein ONS95_001112 [Cadophora gregata]